MCNNIACGGLSGKEDTMIISEQIKYIGVDDTDIDLFESQYVVPKGISYNSYLILDEKTAVLDTVDRRGEAGWEEKLLRELAGRKVDYLVIHHLEPDHAGSIARLVELFPEMVLVGNAKTFAMLPQFFDFPTQGKTLTVKEGDSLCLGAHTLTFVMAPMVHWPEVMVSYESMEKILFAADGFGRFGALELTKNDPWDEEARRYYINIVGKYGMPVQTLLKKAAALDIAKICPLHGPVLTGDLSHYLEKYDIWSSYRPEEKGVLIAYASIHGNTAQAAEELRQMLLEKGVKNIAFHDLARADMAQAVADAFRYDSMILAAPSYDGGVFPCMQDFLMHLQSKAYQNRRVALVENGSWAPSAGKVMKALLETMKNIEIVGETVTIRSALKPTDREKMRMLVDAIV